MEACRSDERGLLAESARCSLKWTVPCTSTAEQRQIFAEQPRTLLSCPFRVHSKPVGCALLLLFSAAMHPYSSLGRLANGLHQLSSTGCKG